MNRVIKFRGKAIHTDKWAYGYLTERENKPCIERCEDYRNNEDPYCDVYGCPYIIAESVGQFTGQYDVNGKEIYEGDIVTWVFFKGVWEIGKVEYKSEDAQFRIINRLTTKDNRESTTTLQKKRLLRVIGNMSDNPELFENGFE